MPTHACPDPSARPDPSDRPDHAACDRSVPPGPPPGPKPLARPEVDALVRLLARGEQARTSLAAHPLVAVGAARARGCPPGPTAVDVYLRPLAGGDGDGDDPVSKLLGWSPPAEWQAVGVVGRGRALASPHPEDPGCGSKPDHPGTTFAHLVTREGASASVAFVAGRPWPPDGATGRPQGEGRIPDLCRRALQLPTRAEPTSSARLHALRWLDAVAVAALRAPGKLTWSDVLARHPALADGTAVPDLPRGQQIGPIDLAVRAARHAADWTWERSRRACAERRWHIQGLTAQHAAWMDAGVFARWALASFPPPVELAGLVGHLLPGTVDARLRAVLSASGVLDADATEAPTPGEAA